MASSSRNKSPAHQSNSIINSKLGKVYEESKKTPLVDLQANLMLDAKSQTKIEPSRYPIADLFDNGHLKVSDKEYIYYEQRGNPTGPVIIYNHGGPGGNSNPSDSQWFDPDYYRIVLYDQRGTGKSFPSIQDKKVSPNVYKNLSCADLVDDLEKLRIHLQVDQWIVFGGSWGSTISLAYSEKYPNKIKGMILYGIFLNQKEEMDQYYDINTIKVRFPERGENALTILHEYLFSQGYKIAKEDIQTFIETYYKLCVTDDDPIAQYLWTYYEFFNDSPTQEALELLARRPSREEIEPIIRSLAIFETLLFRSAYTDFNLLKLENLSKLKDIPIRIIQGLQDSEAPPIFAKKLINELLTINASKLIYTFITDGKHSGDSSFEMVEALVKSTDAFKNLESKLENGIRPNSSRRFNYSGI